MAEKSESTASNRSTPRRGLYLGIAFALLAGGTALMIYMIQTRRGPSGRSEEEPVRLVRVFKVEKGPHRVAVSAYGTSRPSQEWTAIAEVAGQAVRVNERFEPGELLEAGTLLVQIDRTDYELAERRYQAELRSKRAQLDELDETERNLTRIRDLQQRQLELAQADFERHRETYRKGALSDSALATVEGAMIARKTALEETTSQLNLLPAQRELLNSALDAVQTQLEQARRQLEKCQIRVPYDAQCVSKRVEVDQFVTVGERLGTFRALDSAEVVAMVEAGKMGALFPQGIEGFDAPIDLADLPRAESLFEKVKIPAEVRWGPPERDWVWWGRFSRITGTLDPATRTVPVVFEVPHPYRDIRPGVRPPLVPGAFCEVTAYGTTLPDVAVIPRDCLHDGRVYLLRGAKPDGRGILRGGHLEIVSVEVLSLEKGLAAVGEGLAPGDLVVLSEPQGDFHPATGTALPGVKLDGRRVANPVAARPTVDFPPDLFESYPQDGTAASGGGGS